MLLQVDPRNGRALYLRGLSLLKLRNYEGCVLDLSAYLSSDPDNIVALYSRGAALSKLNQPENVSSSTLR
jgi:hypothetical protein